MNRRGDRIRAVIAILAVCVFMAFTSGCKDKVEACPVVDMPIIIGNDGTPCVQDDVCRVEHENGNSVVYTCDIHICKELTADLVIEVDPNDYLITLDYDWGIPGTITFDTETGGYLILSFEDDELKVTLEGDIDMDETTQIFFNEVLKDMADEYIRNRVKGFADAN